MDRITTIGFDADDTLWHNERFFRMTQEHFAGLLAEYTERDTLMARLLNAERRNLARYGYGIKGFMLSMIETAIEVTDRRVPAAVISEILSAGQEMLRHPIDLLPHAEASIRALAPSHHLVLITKGDLLDQERKLAQSGLGDLFDAIEIVSEKTPETYARIFARHGEGAERALMAGNSMKSDVVAPIMAGAWGVHVPHGLEWEIEQADTPFEHDRFRALRHLGELPELVGWIDGC
jgi:putative hydrolase of the HAD superfamily